MPDHDIRTMLPQLSGDSNPAGPRVPGAAPDAARLLPEPLIAPVLGGHETVRGDAMAPGEGDARPALAYVDEALAAVRRAMAALEGGRIPEAGAVALDPPLPFPFGPLAAVDSAGATLTPTSHDEVFEGQVVMDAGPFLDIGDVDTFLGALEQIPGARDVQVMELGADRGRVRLRLDEPVALGREVRLVLPMGFAIFRTADGDLRVNVHAKAPPPPPPPAGPRGRAATSRRALI